jgi:transcriptional regulator with XRE-family HTH domain
MSIRIVRYEQNNIKSGGDMMTKIFPNNIAKLRTQKKISQKELAKRLKISIWHLNKMENHKKPVTMTMAMRIAEELGVTMNDIFLQ